MNRFVIGICTAILAATPALAESFWSFEQSEPDLENRWCSVDTSFPDGSTAALIVYESNDFGMFFHDPAFALPETLAGTLVLDFEDAADFRWRVNRLNDTSFVAAAASAEELRAFIGFLTEKSEVRSNFPNGEVWRMNLSGIGGEMPAFADCLRTHLRSPDAGPESERNPFDTASAAPEQSGPRNPFAF